MLLNIELDHVWIAIIVVLLLVILIVFWIMRNLLAVLSPYRHMPVPVGSAGGAAPRGRSDDTTISLILILVLVLSLVLMWPQIKDFFSVQQPEKPQQVDYSDGVKRKSFKKRESLRLPDIPSAPGGEKTYPVPMKTVYIVELSTFRNKREAVEYLQIMQKKDHRVQMDYLRGEYLPHQVYIGPFARRKEAWLYNRKHGLHGSVKHKKLPRS